MLEDISSTFHGRDIFAPTAAHISLGANIREVGQELTSPKLLDYNKPQIRDDEIIGKLSIRTLLVILLLIYRQI